MPRRDMVLVRRFVPPEEAEKWGRQAIMNAKLGLIPRVEWKPGEEPGANTFAEGRASYITDSRGADQILPDLKAKEGIVLTLMRDLVETEARFAVRERSRYSLKVYRPGDYQGLHIDTNPLTALLCLTHSEAPVFPGAKKGPPSKLEPGDVLLFRGLLQHRVPPAPDWRCTIPFNLYTDETQRRHEDTDLLVYGPGE